MAKDEVNQAVTWFLENAPHDAEDNYICPWCDYSSIETEKGRQKQALMMHTRQQHPEKVVMAYLHPDLGFDAFSILMRQQAEEADAREYVEDNLSVLDERDVYDMLAIPEEFRKKQNLEGGRMRWAAPDKLNRYKTMGAQVMKRPEGWEQATPRSGEDTTLKTNELTLVYFPPALYQKRKRMKQRAADELIGNLTNKGEDRRSKIGDVGKIVYDHFRKQGMPHDNAMVVARNAEKRAAQPSRPDPDNTTVITRG